MSPASSSVLLGARIPSNAKSESNRALTIAYIFLVSMVALVALSLILGARDISLGEVFSVLLNEAPLSPAHSTIIERRLPRTLIAISAGAALSMAGALLQALTCNPLADTGVLGINAGAAFFAALSLSLLGWSSSLMFILMAIVGAAAATIVISWVALGKDGAISPIKLLLSGIAIGAVLEGIADGLILVDPRAFAQVRSWMVGSVDVAGFTPVVISAVGLLIGLVCILPSLGSINLLNMGVESAAALGVNVRRTRVKIMIAVTIMAATATATVGVFTFVGLATPHIIRKLGLHSDRLVVLLCAVIGPNLILLADIAGRLLVDSELPASVVVAFISGPLLVSFAQKGAR